MPKLTEEGRQSRRLQIAEAALRCFARNGFVATSMTDIIRESGLSAGSIYSHFDSKAELVRFSALALLEDRGALLQHLSGGSPGVITPHRLLRRLVEQVLPEELGAVVLQLFAESARDRDLAAVVEEALEKVKGIVARELGPWAQTQEGNGRFEGVDADAVALRMADVIMVNVHGFVLRRGLIADLDRESLLVDLLPDA
ncbi:TetR/AcrR family transcriptional regulator [Galactobacter caseinivorans]|uniref:TetR/AcrR family transcriptional regulator n=1 Tax=Galactobacter caseinivorans TaxID=2676123 RepID=A0A496PIT4_9MICC|nr:TetR/AcrR family transcriptional regulator [Galactobacter caseinivorans]RKW70402.1 TetR/AcrR family transcriptional regulator [Galactobacter caseinivorans]